MSGQPKVRCYLPATLGRLQDGVGAGGFGPAPLVAHAVTDALRAAWPEASDEDWEYAASSAAAATAGTLTGPGEPVRRVVVAADVASVVPLDAEDPTLVEVPDVVRLDQVAAVLVDDESGDPDQELGWYAVQEIEALLSDLGPASQA